MLHVLTHTFPTRRSSDLLYALSLGLKALAGLSAAIGFAITIFAKVALAIIIALGPIFIALALFEPTRRFFHGWLGQTINYIVLLAVIIAVTTLITDLGAAATAASEGVVDTAFGAVLFAAYIFLGTIFFFQAPEIGRAHVCTPVTNAPFVCRLL